MDRSGDQISIVSMDFFFLGDEQGPVPGTIPAVALRDGRSKAIFAQVIPGRGLDFDWPAQ